jgi:hypothetical protein
MALVSYGGAGIVFPYLIGVQVRVMFDSLGSWIKYNWGDLFVLMAQYFAS